MGCVMNFSLGSTLFAIFQFKLALPIYNIDTSRKHAYIILTPLNSTFI